MAGTMCDGRMESTSSAKTESAPSWARRSRLTAQSSARRALGFAAPGWRTNAIALRVLDSMELSYRSDTRGRTPFRCRVDGEILKTLEIPTTLPTLDEVMGREDLPDAAAVLEFYLTQFNADRLNVHTVHAETEGMAELESFTNLIRALRRAERSSSASTRSRRAWVAAELPVCEVCARRCPAAPDGSPRKAPTPPRVDAS